MFSVSQPARLLRRFALVVCAAVSILSHGQVEAIPELRNFLNPTNSVSDPLAVVTSTAQAGASTTSAAPTNRAQGRSSGAYYSSPGPWGKLQCFHIYIEAPNSMVDTYPLPSPRPRWTFALSDLPSLPDLFKRAGLPQSFADAVINSPGKLQEADMIHLFPPVDGLEAMTPDMRQVIYPVLAKLPVNEYHADPVLITTNTVEEWYRTSKLRPEIVVKIRQMIYKRGQCFAFSDLSALMNHAQSNAEARLIFKTFTRTRALMVKLELDKNSANLEELLGYWTTGLGLRRKDIEPILQSILDTEGVERLDLSHILPALARKLLYTYPGMEIARQGIMPDCHWTSLNFFNYEPHPYLLDSRLATSTVLESFSPVEAPYRYGDILFFLDSERGDAFHSCVYLADDIVFTKNGRNQLSPWVMMRIDDVKKIYLHNGNGRVQAYRNKKASSGDGSMQ